MALQCVLYRASRLVGISRRLPASLALLGPSLRAAFDAYVELYPDASAEFDREARSFAAFLATSWLERSADPAGAAELRAILAEELRRLASGPLGAETGEEPRPQGAVGSRTSNRSE